MAEQIKLKVTYKNDSSVGCLGKYDLNFVLLNDIKRCKTVQLERSLCTVILRSLEF